MTEKLRKATHEGTLVIGDLPIPCAVLEDQTRVLSHRGMNVALGRGRGGGEYQRRRAHDGGDPLPGFLSANNLKEFIDNELAAALIEPLEYRPRHGGRTALGIDATVLPKICDVWLRARDAGVLQKQQLGIAAKADILMRGLAQVGIVALVDEATGYQEDRDRAELQRILEAYIAKELLPWTRRFPPDFYRELFRLRGWRYSPLSVARPQYVGVLTNELVYEKLPPGVLDELRRKNPVDQATKRRKRKHHQFLTEDIGNPHLDRHLAAIMALMRAAANWDGFKRMFARAFPVRGTQTELDLGEDQSNRGTNN